ncbi:MAG TPA: AAA family ATPase [Gaiella sp.]
MTAVLVTGMSGTGKSTVLAELGRRGHRVVDTDYGDWIEEVPTPTGGLERQWRGEAIEALLDAQGEDALFVSGCVANQGAFYPRFDAVVLLSAPLAVILERIATRETNSFGRTNEERDAIVRDHAVIEPLLRAGATVEVDTLAPLSEVTEALERIAADAARA